MKTIIAGSRSVTDMAHVRQAIIDSGFQITEVVCGCAHGPDRLGFDWARENKVPVHFFPAWPTQHEWAIRNKLPEEYVSDPMVTYKHYTENKHLWKFAGFARNGLMAFYTSRNDGALVSILDGESSGSADMIKRANNVGLKVYVHRV